MFGPCVVMAAGAVACAGSTAQTRVIDSLAIQLGKASAPCQGTDKIDKARESTAITRRLSADGTSCRYEVSWRGPLLAPDRFRGLPPGESRVSAVVFSFERLQLTDALGSLLEGVQIGELEVRISVGDAPLIRLGGAAPPHGTPREVEASARVVKAVDAAVRRGEAVPGSVVVELELTDAQRRALARRTAVPWIELSFTAEVATGAAAP